MGISTSSKQKLYLYLNQYSSNVRADGISNGLIDNGCNQGDKIGQNIAIWATF